MRKLLVVVVFLMTQSCVIDGPINRPRVIYTPPSLGGTHVEIVNNVRETRMSCRVVGKVSQTYDRSSGAEGVEVGQSAEFFLTERLIGEDRRDGRILCSFKDLEGAYLGLREIRVRVASRGDQDTVVEEINSIDQPRKYRRDD